MPVLRSPVACLRRVASPLLLAVWVAACGPDLRPNPNDPSGDPETSGEGNSGAKLSHVDHGDGTFTTTVDATSDQVWIGLDLDQRGEVSAAEDKQWDVGFQRFHIRTRGGVNGSGAVEAAVLSGVDFAQVTEAPATGYSTDAADGETAFEAGDAWYSYDPRTHKLTPRDQIYVVRTDEGAFFKLQILAYYDSAGTPAMLRVRWGRVQPPSAG